MATSKASESEEATSSATNSRLGSPSYINPAEDSDSPVIGISEKIYSNFLFLHYLVMCSVIPI